MGEFLSIIAVITITSAGVITGLLWAFSNFVIRALADLPAEHGMFAMQRINAKILNPLFLTLFMGTPLLCALIVLAAWSMIGEPGALLLLGGAVLYLAGPFGITVLFNVPLNNRLEQTPASEAHTAWPEYRRDWQRWNHIRSYLGILSIVLLAAGLAVR